MAKAKAKAPEPLFFPTSIRLPIDLKEDIDRARKQVQHTQSGFIVEILRQWQAFQKAKKK
ncbi:MAG TPA: hypothetical protein VMH83_03970 [Candidatus Acidoferrum sp.]|nr:hypothetical protein [Candidatus Acidoferrum sp.]